MSPVTVSSRAGGAGERGVGICLSEPTLNVELGPCVIGITAVTLGRFT